MKASQKNSSLLSFALIALSIGCTTTPVREPASTPNLATSQNPYFQGYLVGHRYLFHSGQRLNLMSDVKAHTVPQEAWDEYVMGAKTNFDLPAYRRGLYGAESIAGTGLYSTYTFLAGRKPWLVMIKLKDACVAPSSIWEGEYSLPEDKPAAWTAFTDWFSRNQSRYSRVEGVCLSGKGKDRAWEEGVPYDVSKASADDIALTQACAPALNNFLNETKIKLVADVENNESWYIRDRSCIDDIVGSPDDLFDLISGQHGLFQDDGFIAGFFGGSDPSNSPVGNLVILVEMISETSRLQANQLAQLKALEQAMTDKAFERHTRPGAELRLDSRSDIEDIAVRLIRAAQNAIAHHAVAPFQQSLRSWLEQTTTSMGEQCQGQHGVSADNLDACGDATQIASRKLMRIL